MDLSKEWLPRWNQTSFITIYDQEINNYVNVNTSKSQCLYSGVINFMYILFTAVNVSKNQFLFINIDRKEKALRQSMSNTNQHVPSKWL